MRKGCLFLLFLVVSCSNAAITPVTEDFTDSINFAFLPNPNYGVFNGSGQLVQSAGPTDMIYRIGQAGDQTVNMTLSSTQAIFNSSYILWTYQLNDSGSNKQRMQLWLQKNGTPPTNTDLWVYVGNYHGNTWITQKWQLLGAVSSFAFKYDWLEATGSLNLYISYNGGPMTLWFTDTGLHTGSAPAEYLYSGGAGSAALDYYSDAPTVPVVAEPNAPMADINHDGSVDFKDYSIMGTAWGQNQPVRSLTLPSPAHLWPTYRHDGSLSGISPCASGLETVPDNIWSVQLQASALSPDTWQINDFNGDNNYELIRIISSQDKIVCQDLLGNELWHIDNMPGVTIKDVRDYKGDGGRGILVQSFTGTQYKYYIINGQTGRNALLYTVSDYFGDERRIGYLLPGVAGQQICAFWDGDDNPNQNRWFHGYIFSFENGVENPNRRFLAEEHADVWAAQHVFADIDGDGKTELVMFSYEKAWVYNLATGAKKAQMSWNLGIRDYRAFMAALPIKPGQLPSFLIINPFGPDVMVITQNGTTANIKWKQVIGPVESQYQSAINIGVGAPDPFIDLDGDGQPEIIVAIRNEHGDNVTNLVIFNANTGARMLELPDTRIISAEDLNHDGIPEVFIQSGNVAPAPGAWISGPGNEIPIVQNGSILKISHFGPTGAGGAYQFTDLWSSSASPSVNPFFKPQPPQQDLKLTMAEPTTFANPVIWRTTPDSNDFLMKFDTDTWSCRLTGSTFQQISQVTVHEALGNNPPPPGPAQTYAWQGNTLVTYVNGQQVYSMVMPTRPTYLAPPPIVGEFGGQVRIIFQNGGLVESVSIYGDDRKVVLSSSPAYVTPGHSYFQPLILADVDGDGSNELIATATVGGQPKLVSITASGTLKLSISPLPNATDMVIVAAGSLGTGQGQWIAIRCHRVNTTTAVAAYNGKTGQQMWVRESYGVSAGSGVSFECSTPTSTYDYNHDGADDLVIISDNFYGIIDVKNNVDLVPVYYTPTTFSQIVPDHWTAYGIPMVVDMLHTGTPQVVVGNSWAMLWTVDLLGNPIWHYRLSSDTDTLFLGREGLADLNGDGKIEVVMAQQDGLLRAFGADALNQKCPKCAATQPLTSCNHSANPLWQYQLTPPVSDFASADLDNDGKAELLCGTRSGLYALKQSGTACNVLWNKDFGRTVGSPVIVDLDNDGRPEILVTTDDGYLRCLGTFRTDLDNSGKVDLVDLSMLAKNWLWSNSN